MLISNKILILVSLLLISNNLKASDTTNNDNFAIKFSAGRIFPKYFFKLNDNQSEIISINPIYNSSNFFEFEFNFKKIYFIIGRYNINRNHDIKYFENNNNQIKSEYHISNMVSLPISLAIPIFKSKNISIYSKLSLIYAKRTDYIRYINYYNNLYKKDSLIYPKGKTEHYNINTFSFSIGFKIEKNIYLNTLYAMSEINYAKDLGNSNYKNGVNRIIFAFGLSYKFFNE